MELGFFHHSLIKRISCQISGLLIQEILFLPSLLCYNNARIVAVDYFPLTRNFLEDHRIGVSVAGLPVSRLHDDLILAIQSTYDHVLRHE